MSDLSVDRPSRSFRQLAARPRAIKTGSNETPETALFSVQDYRHVCTYFRAPGVWLIARRENDCWGGTRRPSKPPRTTIFCLGAPRTPRRAPEPGYLDAERKPGTSRIQRRVELKFWPKLGQTGPENHFVTVSIKARYRQPRIYVVSGYFVVYLRSLPSYEGTTFVRSYLRTYVREGTTFVRSYLRTYLPPIKYVHTNEGIFYIFKVRRYGKYEGRLRRYEGRYERRYEGTKVCFL